MFPSIKLEGKILLVEGNLYCNADRMSNLIEIELSFGKLIIGSYHRIFILLKTDELLQFDYFWTVNTRRVITGPFQPYKHTSEEIDQIASTIHKPFSNVVFLYRNREIVLNNNEKEIFADACDFAERNMDHEESSCYHGNLSVLNKEFDSYEEACEYLEQFNGSYSDKAVRFKDYTLKNKTQTQKTLENKVQECGKELSALKRPTQKTLTCPHCGKRTSLNLFWDIVVSIAIQMLHQRQRQLKHKNLKKRLQQCVKRLMN